MITIRPSQERGGANFGWLDSKHSFSFGGYYDPNYMGFGSLRVINEDFVQPGRGFDTHGHRDMEIITYILDGELEHKDSIGNGSIIRPGELQRMSAGKGILHSEFNPSATNLVHLLQIWIIPDTNGLEPSYEQKNFAPSAKQGKLRLLGSRDGRDGSVTIHQDVDLYDACLTENQEISYLIRENRSVWVQVAKGDITLNGQILTAGDGAAIAEESSLTFKGMSRQAEILLFDMG